jgi:hypothetical protein
VLLSLRTTGPVSAASRASSAAIALWFHYPALGFLSVPAKEFAIESYCLPVFDAPA